MSIDSQFEAEEQDIEYRYNNGEIDLSQYNKEIRDLHREYRAMAEESASEAYENEMLNW